VPRRSPGDCAARLLLRRTAGASAAVVAHAVAVCNGLRVRTGATVRRTGCAARCTDRGAPERPRPTGAHAVADRSGASAVRANATLLPTYLPTSPRVARPRCAPHRGGAAVPSMTFEQMGLTISQPETFARPGERRAPCAALPPTLTDPTCKQALAQSPHPIPLTPSCLRFFACALARRRTAASRVSACFRRRRAGEAPREKLLYLAESARKRAQNAKAALEKARAPPRSAAQCRAVPRSAAQCRGVRRSAACWM
jgi:hypothetical protein